MAGGGPGAIVSDVVYLVDSARSSRCPRARRASLIRPKVICAGHDTPLRGENLRETLERAAEKY